MECLGLVPDEDALRGGGFPGNLLRTMTARPYTALGSTAGKKDRGAIWTGFILPISHSCPRPYSAATPGLPWSSDPHVRIRWRSQNHKIWQYSRAVALSGRDRSEAPVIERPLPPPFAQTH